MANYPEYVGLRLSPAAASDLEQLRTLTKESASAVLRRALDQLLRGELPARLAEAARKGQS